MSDWTSHEEKEWDYMPPEQKKPAEPESEQVLLQPSPIMPSHVHKWNALGVWFPPPGLAHPRIKQEIKTTVLIRCEVCQIPQTIELNGEWTLEQIEKRGNGPGTTTT